MTDTARTGLAADHPEADHPADNTGQRRPAPGKTLLRRAAVPLGYLLAALLLYAHLWADLDRRYLVDSMRDQNQWEWFFGVTAHHVLTGQDPLFSTLQNFPDGVNLMGNTVMLGLSVPLAPLTLWLGPTVTWAVVLTGGLAATATAWYWLIRSRVTANRAAAVLGGAVSAFAPPMISHANAHPNLAVLFVIPLLIDRALRLCEGRRVGRNGVLLGLLTAWQIFLGEEALLLAVSGMLVFALCYAALRPSVARAAAGPLLRGLAIATAVCLPLVAYPLYWQFFGDQSYRSILHGPTGNPLLAFVEFSGRALAGDRATADALSLNPTEQNAFYGWPLVALLLGVVVALWERAVVKALACTAVAAAALSLGSEISLTGKEGESPLAPGPWQLLDTLPLLESVIESRYAMICAPVSGMLLALAWSGVARAARSVQEGNAVPPPSPVAGPAATDSDGSEEGGGAFGGAGPEEGGGRPPVSARDRRNRALVVRVAGCLVLGAALLPVVPRPLEAVDRPEVPAFIADGSWRPYLLPGQSLVPVPLPSPAEATALHWQITADYGFPLPGGYFNGPAGPDRTGIYGAEPRATNDLLTAVRNTGEIPEIGAAERRAARADLDFWRAGVLVLADQPNVEALRVTLDRLTGRAGERVGGVWVWDVG
ncbi:hypothetical protein [Streptomyces sp. TP-A0874]|uniref:hypothetical protein n=1 Tax=Streptomyces sp. TP-A0874 TaxID=549819 RepID=UPI000853ACDD